MQKRKIKNRDKGQSILFNPLPLFLLYRYYFYIWFIITNSNYFLLQIEITKFLKGLMFIYLKLIPFNIRILLL